MEHDNVSPLLPAHVQGLGRVWLCHCLQVAGDHLCLHSTQYGLYHLHPLLREGGGKGERERGGGEEGGGREREEREGDRKGREGREREGRGEKEKEEGRKKRRNERGRKRGTELELV